MKDEWLMVREGERREERGERREERGKRRDFRL
jgi:hypothetical protein